MVTQEELRKLIGRYGSSLENSAEVYGGVSIHQQAFVDCLRIYPSLSSTQKKIFDSKVRELSEQQTTHVPKDPFSLYANYWLAAFDELSKNK